MRNLKKILALVLALVMSLSLMATASAADFPDADKITEKYQTAVEVLTGLEVFKGDADGSFHPEKSISRAETAAIIYRIVTGDVKDEQVGIYADYNIFDDVPSTAWYAGYVNFCANAEYIKGRTDGTFNPQGQVTGYAALAMILRAIGYTANGGFTGPDWEVQTARTAEARKITKNIMTGTLGQPASRETVAEILFQAILVNMVDHNVDNTFNGDQGYFEKDETLGYKTFKLEEIEGVVMANEFADLNTPQVLPEGKTQIQVEGEDNVRTLNYTTKITDIGESRLIYTQNVAKVLSIADTGKNTTKEYGASVDIRTAAKFRDASGLNETTDTEYYTNFEPTGYYTSDWRIEYTIWLPFYTDAAANRYVIGPNGNDGNGGAINTSATGTNHKLAGTDNNGATFYWYYYTKAIKAGDPITLADMDNMYTIFTESNGVHGPAEDQLLPYNEIGQVFVATQTKEDISDKLSYNQFLDTYINPIVSDKNWNTSENGEWVKFIDNNGDGDAEYAFLTQYALTEAVSSYTNKAGDTVMQYAWDNAQNTNTDLRLQNFDDDDHTYQNWDYTVRYMKDDEAIERDVAVGDIVLAAYIDNQYLVSDAESVTTEATNYNYKADEIVAADGNTYGQSGIWNNTTMQNLLASMAPKTTYEMFLDKFGFVRAYRLPGGVQYALVTELYYTNNAQGNQVQDWPMTVELVMPNEDGTLIKKEYNLVNRNTELKGLAAWTQINNRAQTGNYYNWLQPAIAHLGVTWTNMTPVRVEPTLGAANLTYWAESMQLVSPIASLNGSTEFNYGPQNYIGRAQNNYGNVVPVNPTTSFTNVAKVTIDGDNATINGAAEVRLNQNGQAAANSNANNYAVDYIQLTTDSVAKGAVRFPAADASTYNTYVNADNDTEIYVVYDGGVKYFKGYANMPALNADTVGNIHAAYAVARNTTTGTNTSNTTGRNYWVAEVIVYEVETWDDLSETSISLAYYTYNQNVQSANGVTIDTLNNKTAPAKVQLVPTGMAWGSSNNWWDSWGYNARTGFGWKTDNGNGYAPTGYGFYRLYNETAPVEGVMTAAAIEKITKDFNKAGIFAGTVAREIDLAKSGFIPVNMSGKTDPNTGLLAIEAQISIADGKVYSITWEGATNETDYRAYYEANDLWFNNSVYSNVKANDRIIWVGSGVQNSGVQTANFIVDLGSNTNGTNDLIDNTALWNSTATWLKGSTGLWKHIMDEQSAPDTKNWTVTIKHVTGMNTTTLGTVIPGVADSYLSVKKDTTGYIEADDLKLPGYTVNNVYKATGSTPAYEVIALQNGRYAVTPGADMTVYVDYTNSGYSLKVVGEAGKTSTATFDYVAPNGTTGTHASFTLDNTGSGSADTVLANSKFTITATPATNVTLTASITNGKLDSATGTVVNGKVVFTGEVYGAAVVTITETASYSITKGGVKIATGNTNNADQVVYADVPDATITVDKATVKAGETATVTVSVPAGYHVFKVSATGGATVTANANGTYTLTAGTADTIVTAQAAYNLSTSGGNIYAGDTTGDEFKGMWKTTPGMYTVTTANGFWANSTSEKDAWSIVAFVVKTENANENVSFTITKDGDSSFTPIVWSYNFPTAGINGCYEQVILDQYGKIDGSKLDPVSLTPGTYTVSVSAAANSYTGTITVG